MQRGIIKGNHCQKKTRARFVKLLDDCLLPEMTKERVRKFLARARAYICTYYYLTKQAANNNSAGNTKQKLLLDAEGY